jgi:hypothetical protein
MMGGFTPTGGSSAVLDPHKRVNYQLGLVLGEDEFRQDQFHHRERDHHATRALHGYGTVSGLGVSYDDGTGRLHVHPGLAVDPAGRLICVPVEYCASLSGWLREHAETDEVSGGLPAALTVHLVLCWTECPSDDVPVPADSCLSAEDSRAASRLKDSFELRLVLEPPPPVGEVAPGSLDGLDVLVAELHGLLDVSGGSPPDAADVHALLRAWAVDRRPEVVDGEPCLRTPDETCVLLAHIDLTVDDGPSGPAVGTATVHDADRPILVSTRLLQEAMFAVGLDQVAPGHRHALDDLDDVDLGAGPATDDVLTFDGSSWVPGPSGSVVDHGALAGLGDDDHPRYLLADGTRPLSGNLSAAGNRLTDIPPSNAAGQPIVQNQPAGGDLRDRYPNPRLGAIQGTPVNAPAPTERDVLILGGGRWTAGRPWLLPFATVQRLSRQPGQRLRYAVWLNLDAPENRVEVAELNQDNLLVQRETDSGPSFLRRVGPENIARFARNVFTVEVREETTPLRFTFTLRLLNLVGGTTVQEWADRNGIWFLGQSGDGTTVTSFVLVAAELV